MRAARGLSATLAELAVLVDTALANYASAVAANAQIWGASGSGPALVHAMSAAAAPRGIHAETDDIRSTVAALVAAADAVTEGWRSLAGALAGTGAMAGDDPAGAAFGRDVDATAAAAWQGWRRAAILLGAVAGGLVATGNNLIRAESDSTAGSVRTGEPITASAQPVPALPGAPGAAATTAAARSSSRWPRTGRRPRPSGCGRPPRRGGRPVRPCATWPGGPAWPSTAWWPATRTWRCCRCGPSPTGC